MKVAKQCHLVLRQQNDHDCLITKITRFFRIILSNCLQYYQHNYMHVYSEVSPSLPIGAYSQVCSLLPVVELTPQDLQPKVMVFLATACSHDKTGCAAQRGGGGMDRESWERQGKRRHVRRGGRSTVAAPNSVHIHSSISLIFVDPTLSVPHFSPPFFSNHRSRVTWPDRDGGSSRGVMG